MSKFVYDQLTLSQFLAILQIEAPIQREGYKCKPCMNWKPQDAARKPFMGGTKYITVTWIPHWWAKNNQAYSFDGNIESMPTCCKSW
jgi:hypothetical protein